HLHVRTDSLPVEGNSDRPVAIIEKKHGMQFVCSRGCGEVKREGSSNHSYAMDFVRLSVFNRNSIDVHLLECALAFQIQGFTITFYPEKLVAPGLYVMCNFLGALEDVPAFANMRNIRLLLAVSDAFWTNCAVSKNAKV
ncbi:uncharacterized protein BYT42DRAFT_499080, partial [Radiomyces spectabilis]|uniref:uncharacterized protein n=1 Tax=Radiomyces spectabilis TaxID=64574 RepID=UPI00221E47BF